METSSATTAAPGDIQAPHRNARGSATLVELPGTGGQRARVFWVTLEGPIGAGKSELCRILTPRLEEHFGKDRVFYVDEPIDELVASGLFQEYQRDPKRLCFEFQVTFFNKRTDYFRAAFANMLKKLATTRVPQDEGNGIKTAVMLSERSILSDTCFMRVQSECGHCSEQTLERYVDINHKWRELYHGVAPGLVIYCRAGSTTDSIVDLCQQRIRERKRPAEEELVTPFYNGIVLQEHDRVFLAYGGAFVMGFAGHHPLTVPVAVCDTTENYRDDASVAEKKSAELLQHVRNALDRAKVNTAVNVAASVPLARRESDEERRSRQDFMWSQAVKAASSLEREDGLVREKEAAKLDADIITFMNAPQRLGDAGPIGQSHVSVPYWDTNPAKHAALVVDVEAIAAADEK
jgi:deoxyadenosine/deoxycytidine kinase